MSWKALGWAAEQRVTRAADKLVLFALAERHNTEEDIAFPSIAWIAEFSSLDRKTVVVSLGRLEASGLISDSGARKGRTAQVKAYRLHLNSTEKGDPKTEPLKSTVFPSKQSQKRDTDTITEPITPVSSNEETSPPAKLNGKVSVTFDQLQEAWNTIGAANGAIECRRFGPERRRKAQTFLNRHPIDDITEAIEAVARSDFLCGRTDRGFRADIEFLFSPKHMNRLLEGFYDR